MRLHGVVRVDRSKATGARPSPRRTLFERAVLGGGVALSLVVLSAATVVGWGAWKLTSIDREDLSLDYADGPARNYLLVGSDSRAKGHPKAGVTAPIEQRDPLADTIMVLRVDPHSPQPVLLSLPRDLWVHREAIGEKGRINAAYGDGPQALLDTIRTELGIPIHHYIEVDFQGFKSAVDAIGGVPMWFETPVRDWKSDLDITDTGCVTLDGYDALAYARSRQLQVYEDGRFEFDGSGDLGRIERQQLFIRRTIDRAIDEVGKSPLAVKRLVEVGVDNVTLDDTLTVGDLVRLGNTFSSFDADELETHTLPTKARTTTGGAKVLELDDERAPAVLALFRGPEDPAPEPSLTTEPTPEAVKVTILNATGAVGLASATANELTRIGFGIDHWGNGVEVGRLVESQTAVLHPPGLASEARVLAGRVSGEVAVTEEPTMVGDAVVLLLGQDFAGLTAPTAEAGTTTTTTTTTTAPAERAAPSVEAVSVDASARGDARSAAGTVPEVELTVGQPPRGERCG